MPAARACVIFNPKAGRRRPALQQAGFRKLLGKGCEAWPTQRANHAEELAYQAAQAGFAVVAAAGGDGTAHEVANGILRAGRPETALLVLPLGSANDYAYSLQRQFPRTNHQPVLRRVDVGLAKGGDGRKRYFINGLGLGFNGMVTLESRKIRYLRGVPLYSLALLRALCYHFKRPTLTVNIDEQERQSATLGLTVNIGRREGNFLVTPEAALDDGLFDYLLAGRLHRWELLRFLPSIITGRLPTWHPYIRVGRCRHVTVRGETPLTVHLDGELFCLPQDKVRTIEAQLLPAALAVVVGQD